MSTASTESNTITRTSSSWWQQLASAIRAAGNPVPFAIFYFVALTLAEVLTVMVDPQVGQSLHLFILFILMVHTAITWDRPIHRFLLSLAFVPLIRVISLSLPMVGIPLIFWYLIVSVPLFAAVFVAMRTLGLRPRAKALKGRGLLPQLAFGLTGLFFGYIEYLILEPDPLVLIYTWDRLLIAALVLLVSTGLLEEVIFRGIMQRTSIEQLGRLFGIIYVAAIFAMLHIGYRSLLDVFFVFVIGLLFGLFVARTGSLLGVTLSHSLTNTVLFLIIPFWLASSGYNKLPALESIISLSTFESTVMITTDEEEPIPPTPKAVPGVGVLAADLVEKPPTPIVYSASPTPPPTLVPTTASQPLATNLLEQTSSQIIATNVAVVEPTSSPVLMATATSGATQVDAEILCDTAPPGWQEYVVRPGDTLSQLSLSTGVGINEIITANCIDMNTFFSGMHIYLPSPSPVLPSPPPVPDVCNPRSDWLPYIVQPGDTLFSLANSRGVSLQEVLQANCLTSGDIIYNTQILLPPVASPSDLPAATDPPPVPTVQTEPTVSTDATSKQASWIISSPAAGATVSGVTPIIGTADFDPAEVQFYRIELGAGDPANLQWVTLGNIHTTPVVDGTLETLHVGELAPGAYSLRLTLVAWNGNYAGAPYTVQIEIN